MSTNTERIVCQSTALYLNRNIIIVGTANKQGKGFTTMESNDKLNQYTALSVGYYQDQHFQSLINTKSSQKRKINVVNTWSKQSEIVEKPLKRRKVVEQPKKIGDQQCDKCTYTTSQRSNLKKHINSVHEGIQYHCEHCSYSATNNGNNKKNV